LEHRTTNPITPLGTILQPYYNAKTVKSPEMKDMVDRRVSNYCLVTQEQDTDGEVETKLYKGDVIPTTSGGAQMIFNDVECLKQISPVDSPPPLRKRKSASADERKCLAKDPIDYVESRCSMAIHGQSKKQRR
jgi:kinesin family member 23